MWFKPKEQRWSLSADEKAPSPAVPAAGSNEVVLTDAGDRKIELIKTIREHTRLGLADAKDVSERPGSSLGSYDMPTAKAFVAALHALGARAEIRAGTDAPEPQDEQLVADLEKLAVLHRTGVLTDQEFAAAKQRLLT